MTLLTVWFRQFKKTLTQFFYLSRVNENLEICVPLWFAELNEEHFLGNWKKVFSVKNDLIT